MPKIIAAEAVADLLRPGMKIFIQGGGGEPTMITQALKAHPDASAEVHYMGVFVPSINDIDPAGFHDTAQLTTFFIYGDIAKSFAKGKVRFMPQSYSQTTQAMLNLAPLDISLIQVSPPNEAGQCSLGISLDFVPSMTANSNITIAEVNQKMPWAPGAPTIAYDDLDYVVEVDHPLISAAAGNIPDSLETIASHVANLINDGDCVQVGIGKLPAAILSRLADKKDLGLHGGMITDEIMELIKCGALNGACKTIDRHMAVAGVALGSQDFYNWLDGRENILFRPALYTHDPAIVSQIDNFVSINSVLEVDLFGQANAEMIDGRQVSGTGGLVDFIRSARMSRGGRSILALSAVAGKGTISRIVPKLGAGAIVSAARSDVDYVVTEFGAARLKDKDLDERARALIEIAAPAFREELLASWIGGLRGY